MQLVNGVVYVGVKVSGLGFGFWFRVEGQMF